MEKFCVKEVTNASGKTAETVSKSLETNFGIKVSSKTVARALKRNGLKSGEKKKKPFLSKKNMY